MKLPFKYQAKVSKTLKKFRDYPHKILPLGMAVFTMVTLGLSYYLSQLEFKETSPAPTKAAISTRTERVTRKVETTSKSAGPEPSAAKPAPAQPQSRQSGYGFSAGDLPGLSAAHLESRLTEFKAVGVSWIRFDVQWNDVQHGGPVSYDWSSYDRVVAAANRHGLKMLMILDYTPAWARRPDCSGGYKCAPNDNSQFAQYAAEAVKRYAPQGVKNWEIWNEPNHMGAWDPAPDAKAYTDLLVKSYAAMKKSDPAAFILTGGTGVTYTDNGNIGPADFMAAIYKYGGKNSFDGVGQHPYTYPALATLNEEWTGWYQMLEVRAVMAANGDSGKPVWLTEYGAPTQGPGALATQQNFNFENNPDHVDEALQQQIVSVAIGLHKGYTWAGPLFWYGYKDLGTDPGSNENFFGLMHVDGSQKPAYATFKSLIR